MASEQHEGKGIGSFVRESFQKGMDQAREKRKRTVWAKWIAADRGIAQTEHRLREKLAAIAAGNAIAEDRAELATEIEVWQALYDDRRKATG